MVATQQRNVNKPTEKLTNLNRFSSLRVSVREKKTEMRHTGVHMHTLNLGTLTPA